MDEKNDYIKLDVKKDQSNEKVELVEEENKIEENLMPKKKAYLFLNYIVI